MYNETQAKNLVELKYPSVKSVDCFKYKTLFLVRVKHDSEDEADYDPFFSVDPISGDVQEFSVTTDADPTELAAAVQRR